MDGATFLVHNDMASFEAERQLADVQVLVFVAAGGEKSILAPLYAKLPKLSWVHSFFAGVDALHGFITECIAGTSVRVTNGKGAFSESLAEWVMTAVLHFNKQVPRIMANRKEKKWDKFVMNTVAGKTLGLVGYGHIGQCCARVAKQGFGMRIMAVRNNPDRESPYADVVVGQDAKKELFQQSDFVVCT